MKAIIVGGVAGGASCAARLRRLDEKAEILLLERGPYVSYDNCGLPYYVGGVIENESSLLIATKEVFQTQFTIDCRTNAEVIAIDSTKKTVTIKNRLSGFKAKTISGGMLSHSHCAIRNKNLSYGNR